MVSPGTNATSSCSLTDWLQVQDEDQDQQLHSSGLAKLSTERVRLVYMGNGALLETEVWLWNIVP